MFDLELFCKMNDIEMIRNDDFNYTMFRMNRYDRPYVAYLNEEVDTNPVDIGLKLIRDFSL